MGKAVLGFAQIADGLLGICAEPGLIKVMIDFDWFFRQRAAT